VTRNDFLGFMISKFEVDVRYIYISKIFFIPFGSKAWNCFSDGHEWWYKKESAIEMGPDPTQAYFWIAVNKRPTRLRPGYFLTWTEEIFFDPKEKLTFLVEIFQIQTQTINGWPNTNRVTKNRPDPVQKILTWTHH